MSADVRIDVPGEVSEEALAADADRILEAMGHGGAELSVLVTSDEHIAELNASYRGVAGPTDVLSFPQGPGPGGREVLGDVVIGAQRASAQAAEQGHGLRDELRVLLVHGVLHLLGHDHETPDDRAAMSAAEHEVLAAFADAPEAGLVGRSGEG